MHAHIMVTITDTVRGEEIPEKQFVAKAPLTLELPSDPEEFIAALENLVSQNLNPILQRLVAKVRSDAAAYLKHIEETGLRQPDLPGLQGQ